MMGLNVQCKKCANLRNDWCKLVVDSPDPDMVRDCQYYRGKTNADKIRQMTDEELASFMEALSPHNKWSIFLDGKRWLDWLKQEVESNG